MNRRRLPDEKFKGIRLKPEVKTYRLFVGIFPPDSYIKTFKNVIREFDKEKRNIKPLPMDQIHLTLKFIGSAVSEDSKNRIVEALNRFQGRFPKPVIKLSGVQFGFPYQNDPRVIIANVETNKDLMDLTNKVHGIIRDLRLLDTIRWREKNLSELHMSLARLKPAATRSSGRDVNIIAKKIKFEVPESFVPEYLDIVESLNTRGEISYKRLGRIKL